MHIADYLLLFGSVLGSGSLFFLVKKPSAQVLKLLLSFSGAFLFAITVLHLMPEVYLGSGPGIGVWVMLGFLLQIILEFFSEGIEHGHVHIHPHHEQGRFPLTMMISLSLHSFLEGMPLGGMAHSGEHHSHAHGLLYGIVLHHVPVAFALTSMLVGSGITRAKTWFYLLLFAAMAPLGALLSDRLHGEALGTLSEIYPALMAVVIGIFLHISTTILFESSSNHRFHLKKMVAIVAGGFIGWLAFSN
jgi:zinc transporter ZupT